MVFYKNNQIHNLINPFNNPLCSISSFVFMVYKIFYLNSYPIFAITNEYGKNHKNISLLEYKYCTFMDYKYPEKKFQYTFSNPNGAKYYFECVPDLYSPLTNEVIFFNGCYL